MRETFSGTPSPNLSPKGERNMNYDAWVVGLTVPGKQKRAPEGALFRIDVVWTQPFTKGHLPSFSGR